MGWPGRGPVLVPALPGDPDKAPPSLGLSGFRCSMGSLPPTGRAKRQMDRPHFGSGWRWANTGHSPCRGPGPEPGPQAGCARGRRGALHPPVQRKPVHSLPRAPPRMGGHAAVLRLLEPLSPSPTCRVGVRTETSASRRRPGAPSTCSVGSRRAPAGAVHAGEISQMQNLPEKALVLTSCLQEGLEATAPKESYLGPPRRATRLLPGGFVMSVPVAAPWSAPADDGWSGSCFEKSDCKCLRRRGGGRVLTAFLKPRPIFLSQACCAVNLKPTEQGARRGGRPTPQGTPGSWGSAATPAPRARDRGHGAAATLALHLPHFTKPETGRDLPSVT